MFLYNIAVFFLRLWSNLCGYQVIGRENVPAHGRIILVGNHTSYADPCLMASAVKRWVHFIGKEELFQVPILGTLFRWVGAFPVKRGQMDLKAIKTAVGILKEEGALGIFAEGKRNLDGEMSEFKDGAAFIAYKSDAPMIPVAIFNAQDYGRFWKRNLKVVIGKPIYMEKEGKKGQEVIATYTEVCRAEIVRLLSENAVE